MEVLNLASNQSASNEFEDSFQNYDSQNKKQLERPSTEIQISHSEPSQSNEKNSTQLNPQKASLKPENLTLNEDQELTQEEKEKLNKQIEAEILSKQQNLQNFCQNSKKRLDLSAQELEDFDALIVSIHLNETVESLTLFHVGSNKITDEGLFNLIESLVFHEQLKEIYLGNNLFTPNSTEAFISIMNAFQSLKILSLNGSNLDDECMIAMCYQLEKLPSLENLQIAYNNISDDGFMCLGMLFASEQVNINTLYMGGNPVTQLGLLSFFESLFQNKKLKNLHLNETKLESEEVLKTLKELLKNNNTLQNLNFMKCELTDLSVESLALGLKKNETLTCLQLINNSITDEGAKILVNLLENFNTTLEVLGIDGNPIDEQELLDEIKMYLNQNKSMGKQLVESQLQQRLEDATKLQPPEIQEVKEDQDAQNSEEEEKEDEENESDDEKQLDAIEKEISKGKKQKEPKILKWQQFDKGQGDELHSKLKEA